MTKLRLRGLLRAGLLGSSLLFAAAGARAQSAAPSFGFAVDTFHPSPRGSDWFVLDSLDFRDDGRGAIGVVTEYAYKPLVLKSASGPDIASLVTHQLFVHPGASIVVLDRLRLSGDLPVAVVNQGSVATFSGAAIPAPGSAALGDASFAADLRMFGRYGEVVTGAVGVEALAPTGSPTQYTGDGKTRIEPRLLFGGIAQRLEWSAHLGLRFRTEDPQTLAGPRGHSFVFGASVGWRGLGGRLVAGPELYGSTSFTQASAANSPVEALVGAHYAFAPEWRVGLGVGPGFGSGLGSPLVRAALSLEFVALAEEERPKKPARRREGPSDRDHDTIPDTLDACPDVPGPPNIDAALNGCPPPPDTDGDGIADDVDACPEEKGSPNADPEANGCPPDADNDGVPDAIDACPLRAGVEQADKAQNGCPPDSDKDGVIDADDACPDVPGAVSKDPLDNGCPLDRDRDHDGIPNEADACPREPGPRDPDPKKNGCPRAALRGSVIQILDQVRFEPASARIAKGKDMTALLGAIAKVLIDHPEIKKVEVEGHTDDKGDAAANKRLSEQRARAVVAWLVGQGIDGARLTSVGYGSERPLQPNTTEEGRKANRRVELHVIAGAAPAPEEKKP